MMTQALALSDIQTIEVSQMIAGMSPGMKEIERLLLRGQLTHNENPVARWCFGNVVVHVDGNENMKPMKNKSYERIDLMVALIDAMSVAVKLEPVQSAYETHGLRVV
jgi:phage terminase large subunit-like protein